MTWLGCVLLAWVLAPAMATAAVANALEIESVNLGVDVTAGSSFSVVVRSFNGGSPADVNQPTGVTLSVLSGTGTLAGSVSGTIADNTNTVTLNVTYTKAESGVVLRVVQTSGTNLTADDSSPFTVVPGAAAKLALIAVNGGSNVVAGSAFPVVVQSQDANNNPAPVVAATDIALTRTAGTGTLGGSTGTIAAGANSVTLTAVTYTKAEAGVVLTASRTSGDTLSSGASATFTAVAGAATKLVVLSVNGGADVTAGTTFPVVVQVQDANDNVATVASATGIQLTRTSGTGTLGGTTGTIVAGTSGVTLTLVTYTKAEAGVVLTASRTSGDTLSSGASAAFTAVAGAATKLVVVSVNGGADVTAGTTFPVVVQVQDANDNVATVASATGIQLTRTSGTGTLGGATGTIVAGTSGVTLTLVTYTKAEAGVVLTVSRTSGDVLASGTSASFTAVAGGASRLAVVQVNGGADVVAGTGFAVQVQVRDANDNLATVVAATGVQLALGTGTGIVAGTLTGTITPGASGVTISGATYTRAEGGVTLTASRTSGDVLTTGASAGFTVVAGAATRLRVVQVNGGADVVAGTAFAVQVQVRDANDNLATVTQATGIQLTVASGTGTLGGTVSGTIAASGSAVTISGATYTRAEAGVSITAARSSGDVLTSNTSTGFLVVPGAAARLVVSGSATQIAGETQDITLTVQDQFGNTTNTNATFDVTLAASGVGGGFNDSSNQPRLSRATTGAETTLGAATALTFSAGVASVAVDPLQCRLRLVRAGVASLTAMATSPSLASATPLVVTVSSGAAHHLAVASVNGGTAPTAGVASTVVVEVRDRGDNVVVAGATTTVELSLIHAGTIYAQSLSGTLSGTLSPSQSNLTFTTVTCNQVAALPFALRATDTTSPVNPVVLASGTSASFTVINDVPVLTVANATPLSYVGGADSRVLDPNATVVDASSLVPDHFAGGSLVARITTGAIVSEDVLLIDSSAPIIATGGRIYYNDLATQIGTVSGGTAGADLTITLNANATPVAVDALAKKIAYLNLSGTAPTTTDRTVSLVVTDGDGAASAVALRTITLVTGNELPQVVTNGGLVIPRGATQALTSTNLLTTDPDNPASQITYTLVTPPTQGALERGGVALAANGIFTQAEINAGDIAYHHGGGSLPSDVLTFSVSDGVNQPLSGRTFAITVQGAAQNPVLALPVGKLIYVEGAPAPVVMEPGAPFTSATSISDSFSLGYDFSTLDIEFVDDANATAGHSGDRIGIRDQSPDAPPPILYPGPQDFSTGWIARISGEVYHRQYPFYYYWANNVTFNPVFAGSFPSPASVGYPVSWYWGFPLPLDYAIADVDSTFDGLAGRKLRLRLRSGFSPFLGEPLVNRSSIARLIANTTIINDSDDPPSGTRSLRFTLTVGAPTGTGGAPVGIASRAVEITPVNDPPRFVPGSQALTLTTLSGIPLNAAVVASDSEAAQTRTFTVVSNSQPASGAFTLDASTGRFTYLPQTAFSGTTTVVIRVTDNQGGSTGGPGNPDAVVTLTTLGGTTIRQPFVTSDPPLEVEEGAQFTGVSSYTFSVLTNQTLGPASVTVQLVGDFPAGTTLPAGAALTGSMPPYSVSFTLTSTQPIVRPPSVFYRFGIRVVADHGPGGVEVGYQPVTLRVRALGAAN